MKTVNICGRGKDYLKVNKYDGDVFVLNDMYNSGIKRIDVLFDMHNTDHLKTFQNRWDGSNHYENLKTLKCKVIMQKHFDEIPTSEGFPLQIFKRKHFTSTFCYMIAYAISQHYRAINVFGVSAYTAKEYTHQREGISAWVMYAEGMGIKVNFITDTNVLPDILYGYEEDDRDLGFKPIIFNMTALYENFTQLTPKAFQLQIKANELEETLRVMDSILKGERVVSELFKILIGNFYELILSQKTKLKYTKDKILTFVLDYERKEVNNGNKD